MVRVFYGWTVLGGLFVMYAVSNGISNFTLPLLYPSLMEEFDWNESEVTFPATIKFLFASLYNLAVGYLLDRYPPRPIMATGALVMVGGLGYFLFMDSLWEFTAVYLVLAFGLSMCGLIPMMVTTSRWFVKYRGRAVGILLMASSFGGFVIPQIVKGPIADGDWRSAVVIMIVIGFIGLLLPVLWPVRARPEDIGKTPDGLTVSEEVVEREKLGVFGGATVPEVARLPIFYLLLLATGIVWFCITGVIQHQAIYLRRDVGLDGGTLVNVVSLFFWFSIFGKFIFGWLSDHFAKVNIMLLAILNLVIGLLILRFVEGASVGMVYLYAIVYGIGFSGAFTMVQLMVAELFSGPTYGRILGIYVFADTLAASAGIYVLGKIRVASESYVPAIDLMLCMVVAALACVLAVKRITTSGLVQPAAAQ